MPRDISAGLITLLTLRQKQIETHTTLQILVDNSDIQRDYRFAPARLTINGAVYDPQLRRIGQIRASLTPASDQSTIDLQNVDTELGREFLELGDALVGASVKSGLYVKDLESGAEFHEIMLSGALVGLRGNQNVVELAAVTEPYANISVGATRRIASSCQWEFRNVHTCQYSGSLLTCNFLLNDAGGCQGRHGDPLKRAKFGGFPYINSRSRLTTL